MSYSYSTSAGCRFLLPKHYPPSRRLILKCFILYFSLTRTQHFVLRYSGYFFVFCLFDFESTIIINQKDPNRDYDIARIYNNQLRRTIVGATFDRDNVDTNV